MSPTRLTRGLLLASLGALSGSCGETAGTAPAVQVEESYLTPEERQELFDLERADRLLGLSLSPFSDGIAFQDEKAIRKALVEGFTCTLPVVPEGGDVVAAGDPYRFSILEEFQEHDTEGFLEWIDDLGARFELIETVAFGRYNNSKEIIAGPDAVAQSSGVFRIAGWRDGKGLLELTGVFQLEHAGFATFDGSNEDAEAAEEEFERPDHFIRRLDLEQVSLVSSNAPLFTETTDASGIDVEALHDNWRDREEKGNPSFTGGVFLGDVNADGHLDLFVTEFMNSKLWFGDGDGTFTFSGWKPPAPVVKAKGGQQKVVEAYAAVFDATGDGRVDVLYAGRLYSWDPERGKMILRKDASKLPNADATLCDYDGDGLIDIYYLNSGRRARKAQRSESKAWFDDERVTGAANQLFRNLGGGQFEDVTKASNASPAFGRTFAAVWFYANDDAWPDLFGANEFGRNVFLTNNGDGTFTEQDDVDDVFGGFSMGVSAGDLDGDGKSDLYVSNMYSKAGQRVYSHLDLSIYPESARRMFMASVTGNRIYRSKGDLSFDNLTTHAGANAVGWAWSGALTDADLDGWLDAYAPCGYNSVDASKPDG